MAATNIKYDVDKIQEAYDYLKDLKGLMEDLEDIEDLINQKTHYLDKLNKDILNKDYDDAIMEIVEAVEDDLDGEILNGENLELVIRHYLEGKKIDMSDVSGDSDTGLISMSANDEKKMKKIIKEVNKFLKNKKKVIKYIKENKEEIEWD